MNANVKLFLKLITLPIVDDEVINQLNNLSIENWQGLLKIASLHGLKPLLYASLDQVSTEIEMPVEVYTLLRESYINNTIRNIHFLHHGKQILTKLNQAGIQAIGLKGIYLLDNVYQDIGLRTMSDLDIMVKKKDIIPAIKIIQSLNYQPTTYFDIEDTNFDIKHVPPYIKENGPYLELHWTILAEDEPFSIDVDALWQRAIPAKIAGAKGFSMSTEDFILHLCLHLTYQHNLGLGLSRLYDIWKLLQLQTEHINWMTLFSIAQTWQTQRVTALSLHLAKTIFNAEIPSDVISTLSVQPVPDDMFQVAMNQLLIIKSTPVSVTPDMAKLAEADSVIAKIRVALSRVFLPRQILARLYNIHPKSPKVFFYFLVRLWQLIRAYSLSIWMIVNQDESALSDVNQTKAMLQLRKWLGENQP